MEVDRVKGIEPHKQPDPVTIFVISRAFKGYLSELYRSDNHFIRICTGIRDGIVGDTSHKTLTIADTHFDETNYFTWKQSPLTLPVLKPPVHTCENYFLDWRAIAAGPLNVRGLRADDIEAMAYRIAEGMIWWMATLMILDEKRQLLSNCFPVAPEMDKVYDLRTSEEYITGNVWFRTISENTASVRKGITKNLHSYYHLSQQWFDTGEWVRKYSGKEIFYRLLPMVCPNRYASITDITLDWVHWIAEYQKREGGTVPTEFNDLRNGILRQMEEN